eukprot:Skav221822  [mRNA]  locus=scaffold885:105205:113401:+ [translate_table: standard]
MGAGGSTKTEPPKPAVARSSVGSGASDGGRAVAVGAVGASSGGVSGGVSGGHAPAASSGAPKVTSGGPPKGSIKSTASVSSDGLPEYWYHNKMPANVSFDEMYYTQDKDIHSTFDKMFEASYVKSATRDRPCPSGEHGKTPGGMFAALDPGVNELYAFHGTFVRYALSIAENAAWQTHCVFAVLVCRVTMGKMNVTSSDKEAGEKVQRMEFDSTCGKRLFRELVIYYSDQCYPENVATDLTKIHFEQKKYELTDPGYQHMQCLVNQARVEPSRKLKGVLRLEDSNLWERFVQFKADLRERLGGEEGVSAVTNEMDSRFKVNAVEKDLRALMKRPCKFFKTGCKRGDKCKFLG